MKKITLIGAALALAFIVTVIPVKSDDAPIVVTDVTQPAVIQHQIKVSAAATASLLTQFLPAIDATAPSGKVPATILITRNADGSSQVLVNYVSP